MNIIAQYSDIITAAIVAFSTLPFILFFKEKLSKRKYAKFLKDIFKAILLYVDFNNASIIVKDKDGKTVFSTRKKYLSEVDHTNPANIENIEVTINNEIKVYGKFQNPIEIIEKFCMSQVDLPHSGFVKINNIVYFFIAKKICLDEKYYYLYVYQIEFYVDMKDIIKKLKDLKGISYVILDEELILFRGDEDLGVIKKELKIKCI